MPTATIGGGGALDVDPEVFAVAAASFLAVNASVADAVVGASAVANGGHGMAGAFSDGVDWAKDYDTAAASALTAGSTLVDSLGRIGVLLSASGANHADADTASVPGGPPASAGPGGGSDPDPVAVIVPAPPTASGAPGDPPAGWFLVSHLLSFAWPDGHQGRLREVAEGWNTAADALSGAADRLTRPIGDVSAQRSPEVADAVSRCCQVQLSARDVATGFRAVGTSCSDLAQHIDDAHAEIVHELEMLLAQEVAMQVAGALLAVVTAGVSEVAAQAASVARVAWTASRIGTVLERLGELVRALVTTIRLTATRLGEIVRDLRGILALGDETAGLAYAGGYTATGGSQFVMHSVATGAARGAARTAQTVGSTGRTVARVSLRAQEKLGGHTIRRHVAKTNRYLRRRRIPYASTFTDLKTAESVIATNLQRNIDEIDAWLAGTRSTSTFTSPAPASAGRVYEAASQSLVPVRSVSTTLVRHDGGYRILTSFLEP